jgi:transglutaminase-like putative cysteine protease
MGPEGWAPALAAMLASRKVPARQWLRTFRTPQPAEGTGGVGERNPNTHTGRGLLQWMRSHSTLK